ncbi:MAG TPA: GNAT family N-acetyltransferase [Gemmatimonadaceae bacterium]|nr:GNAT family N-acetyltransferase [Gemmatimonadaceae bacterium]
MTQPNAATQGPITIEVRPAAPSDAPAIAAIAQEVHEFHARALPAVFRSPSRIVVTPQDVVRQLETPRHTVLVAFDDGELVGYAMAEEQEEGALAFKRPAIYLYVHVMGVTEGHRSRGIGRALLAALRDQAAARGLTGVTLDVYAFNTGARAFYEREGFAPLRERMLLRTQEPRPAGNERRTSPRPPRSNTPP